MALERLFQRRSSRRIRNVATLGLVLLGPVLAIGTFLLLGPLDQGATSHGLRAILLADLVYSLAIATMVVRQIARMVAARRSHSAGSRLHMRLTGVFATIALVPTVLVAVFAGLTINIGLEGWFSERVRNVVGASLSAAEAYEEEHRRDLAADAQTLAGYLNVARHASFMLSDGELRQLLTQAQARVQRGLKEAYVIDGTGEIKARGERSYLFDYEQPTAPEIARAAAGETVIIDDWDNNEFRALLALGAYVDRFLYISRSVDGELLSLLDDTQATSRLYQQLESERGRVLFEFGLLYLGFAMILILAAVWLGLWFAERLSRPVGRLAGAAQRVGAGDLDVRVREEAGDDEIAMLGRMFNQMTRQLKLQRDALLENNRQTEMRRRLFDSVLSSVTAGVIGLDAEGRVEFMNRSALTLLQLDEARDNGHDLRVAVPEFAALLDRLRTDRRATAQEEIRLIRSGKMENLLVRMSTRRGADGRREGYVVAFDDVTDLVTAQRMAAWGDVARRIAHEIKNPLTPIQLSAERIKRKFRPLVGDQADTLDQYTDVIVRQTGDLRRIVDEFSKFARMPEPERKPVDLAALVRDALVLQESGQPGVRFVADLPEGAMPAELDPTMISQALTNLIKNAGEAIETRTEKGVPEGFVPEIRLRLVREEDSGLIEIADNGIGLPEDRARLFEPYVTTRDSGTGLGLPIVRKIIEEHGGTLELVDAEPFAPDTHRGAMAVIRLPVAEAGQSSASAINETRIAVSGE
ncbi:PAS domain-containing sensor histidine kinase [Rhodovulum tesquicola]|uniref:sensor histidine kinase NtrY-like n=1 Tax=Rhodovulum tesquicola TaxID=540254 RepID=UPI002097CF3F|nr:PAS domain-containing sensor histidine kinase [Rhodovulum tesquicola]MCO8145936.1 PAS domain-containing sensor histidine kinase [Rhodovulum tesquicola]